MKLNIKFNLDPIQFVFGFFWFVIISVLLAGAIVGFSHLIEIKVLDKNSFQNQVALIVSQITIYATIPMSLYLMFFTKFNLPFKRVKNNDKR